MKKVKVAINGLGRIGKCILRAYIEAYDLFQESFEICVINSNNITVSDAIYGLQYDSTHGTLEHQLIAQGNYIKSRCGLVEVLSCKDIIQLDWKMREIDIVLECTGQFNNYDQAIYHVNNGAKKVIVSAPCSGADVMIVLGVNDNALAAHHNVISIGSCTTNCIAPIVKILDDNIGIEHGFMTTIHAYTNDQNLLDGRHKDKRRGRAASMSMVPTTTGAAKSLGSIIPSLRGKIDGVAVRVPVHNVSLVDLKFTSMSNTNPADINQLMQNKIHESNVNVLNITYDTLVSSDFNHTKYSSIFDATQTYVVGERFCRVAAWYDNEWGFANRMLDVCKLLVQYL